jgi:hypothetical protein
MAVMGRLPVVEMAVDQVSKAFPALLAPKSRLTEGGNSAFYLVDTECEASEEGGASWTRSFHSPPRPSQYRIAEWTVAPA